MQLRITRPGPDRACVDRLFVVERAGPSVQVDRDGDGRPPLIDTIPCAGGVIQDVLRIARPAQLIGHLVRDLPRRSGRLTAGVTGTTERTLFIMYAMYFRLATKPVRRRPRSASVS